MRAAAVGGDRPGITKHPPHEPMMEEWIPWIIGVGIVVTICICGEIAEWVKEDDDEEAARAAGLKSTQSATYLGAPTRMHFKTFDVSKRKKKKGPRVEAHIEDLRPLHLSDMTNQPAASEINLTPRDADGNEQLLSVSELAQGAPLLRQYQLASPRAPPCHRSARTTRTASLA